MMKRAFNIIAVVFIFIATGCTMPTKIYTAIDATVEDAETGAPIEGAVVFVEWSKPAGLPGHLSQKVIKTAEVLSDRDGKVRLPGVFSVFANPPTIVVYKKGYVAWRNDYIFYSSRIDHRNDFRWKDGYVFKLDHFKINYSHSRHISFLRTGLSLSQTKLDQAYSWEEPLASKENYLYGKKIREKKYKSNNDIWNEIIDELYLRTGGRVHE